MNESERAALIDAWISGQRTEPDSPERERYGWAIEAMWDIPGREPELAWDLIARIYEKDKSPEVLGALTAGPLEDLMEAHGTDFIARVEAKAISDPLFRNIMSNVWLVSAKSEAIRFYKAAGIEPFKPPRRKDGG